jgi:hypothetical protein
MTSQVAYDFNHARIDDLVRRGTRDRLVDQPTRAGSSPRRRLRLRSIRPVAIAAADEERRPKTASGVRP